MSYGALKSAVDKIKSLTENTGGSSSSQTSDNKNGMSRTEYNPYLDSNGNLFNKYINYQNLLDNPDVSNKAKEYVTKATGLQPAVATTATASPTQKTEGNIVSAAKSYIGTPYVWGGESVSEGGMDCSGFVYNALKDAGYNVSRTTAQGFRNYGESVSKSNVQPGDLVFYGKNGKASHVGIYIGNGQIVHSAGGRSNTKSNPGKGVSIVNVDHRSDFIEARRF